jgi:hypothetical protein
MKPITIMNTKFHIIAVSAITLTLLNADEIYTNACLAKVEPTLPGSVTPILEQYPANCFSWQQFIYLNWPAGNSGQPDSAKKLGDSGPVVWETFRDIETLFLDDGKKPAPWGHGHDAESVIGRMLERTSKSKKEIPVLDEITQAAPTIDSWLVAKNGTIVRYEVLVNEIEFEYIYKNQFYNADKQAEAMKEGSMGINQPVGSMEIKAAWMEMTEDDDKSRFLTTEATIPADPNVEPSTKSRKALMGLVGMHIIHKTPNSPQYIWSTFEHVDNAPDYDQDGTDRPYNFFTPHFQPQNYNLTPEQNPNQVKRVTKISPITRNLNDKMRTLIDAYNITNGTKSPLANYVLIDTQWPGDALVVKPRAKTPLPDGNMIPRINLNATLETYVQYERISCMDCHRHAPAAGTKDFGSDYSFIYGSAKSPAKKKP